MKSHEIPTLLSEPPCPMNRDLTGECWRPLAGFGCGLPLSRLERTRLTLIAVLVMSYRACDRNYASGSRQIVALGSQMLRLKCATVALPPRCYVGGWLELHSIPEYGTDTCAAAVCSEKRQRSLGCLGGTST